MVKKIPQLSAPFGNFIPLKETTFTCVSNPTTACHRRRRRASMANLIGERSYSCQKCGNHISRHDDIISKGFQSRKGRAFLFYEAKNVTMGPQQEKMFITGQYVVSDVFCCDCGESLGWKYIKAYDQSQKYKEGRVVLEKFKITTEDS